MNVEEAKQRLLSTRKRGDLINYMILKNGYKSYLEIGVRDGVTFNYIQVDKKDGVDIEGPVANLLMTSDAFFEQNEKTYDIVFIDGAHLWEQVLRDVKSALGCLNKGGRIILHDCLPERFHEQVSHELENTNWTGDVWKAAAQIRMTMPDIHLCVLQMDWGCGVLTPGRKQGLYPSVSLDQLTWGYYVQHRQKLLNMKRLEDWLN